MRTRRALVSLCIALASWSVATTADATTAPGTVYVFKAVVDDRGVHFPAGKFGAGRYPRGSEMRYVFVNKGTRPYAVRVWITTTTVMKPGGRATIFAVWPERGTFRYWRLLRGKRLRPIGTIVVF